MFRRLRGSWVTFGKYASANERLGLGRAGAAIAAAAAAAAAVGDGATMG